jgi:DeoD family purine-nucleoside phosphorylase
VPGVTRPASIHLSPCAPLAERVLLPGDPHRALAVAQAVLDEPRMFNHQRGLWGYTGAAADGEPLTVQATGMGGPSAAIVVEELIDLGATTLLRIGTCGALRDGFELGDLVAAEEVIAADGTSRALGAGELLRPDSGLLKALLGPGEARPVTVVSTDLFYDPRGEAASSWLERGADVVEMEAAALLAVAARREVAAAVVLTVSDLLGGGDRRRASRDELAELGVRLGEAGWSALAAAAPTP